ncbi:MAG: YesL family protein [Muricoprocola sp.]
MRDFFNMDNALFRALGKLADLMILNICFIIFSIPIVTMGASFTGMYYVTLKMAENEEGYVFRSFWKSFKQNFKQATCIWLIVLALGIILVLDLLILKDAEGTMFTVMRVMITALVFVYLMLAIYVFPVLARFYNSVKGTLKNALLIAIANFPYTLLMLVICIAAVVITFLNGYTLWYGLLVWILAGFSGIAYANSFFLKKIFKKYIPETEEEEEDPDHWVTEDLPEEDVQADAQEIPAELPGDETDEVSEDEQ